MYYKISEKIINS